MYLYFNQAEEKAAKKAGNKKELTNIKKKRAAQLTKYKANVITWLQSLSKNDESTKITFVRNLWPKHAGTSEYIETSAKPVWVTGLGVESALDCGSGKVALVDGRLGVQLTEPLSWDTTRSWDENEIEQHVESLNQLLSNAAADGGVRRRTTTSPKVIAYGTGNWRKPHMDPTWRHFQTSLQKINVEFQLLPGELEAKYGGISTLKLASTYAPKVKSWVVIEMGGGSTQITRFDRNSNENQVQEVKEEEVKEEEDGISTATSTSGVEKFVQKEFAKARRRSITVREVNKEWTEHVDPETGKTFYHNEDTGVSQYENPEAKKSNVEKFVQKEFAKARRRSITVREVNKEWTEHVDPETGKTFYHNEDTGISQYENPAEDKEEDKEEEEEASGLTGVRAFVQAEFKKKRRSSISEKMNDEWTIHTDPETNSIFYHNETTGMSTWQIPDEMTGDDKDWMENEEEQEEVVEDKEDEEEEEDEEDEEEEEDESSYADLDDEEEEQDPEDLVPESAYTDLLMQLRSLQYEARQWRLHSENMEENVRKLQRSDRGLRAEIQHLETVAWKWKERALSAERSLLGFSPIVREDSRSSAQQQDYRTQRNWW